MDSNSWPVYNLVTLTLLDVVVTLPYWHLEANAYVLQLGKAGFIAVNVTAAAAAVVVWKRYQLHESRTAKAVVFGYNAVLLFVLATNLATIIVS